MKTIRKIIFKLIGIKNFTDLVDLEVLQQKLNEHKRSKCLAQVTINEKSQFYEEASVHNFQNDNLKIFIGKNTHIRGELLIFACGGKITIGNNCYIGVNSRVWSAERVVIGNNVLISHNVNIMDTNSHEINYEERRQSYLNMLQYGHSKEKGNVKTAPVTIEDNVWIGFNVTILKGVRIGKGAIIASGTLVTKDIKPFSMVRSNHDYVVTKI